MLSEVFFVAFVATVSSMIIKLASLCAKSKCSEVSCFGLKIIRDVELEAELEEHAKAEIPAIEDK